jgi:imidazole glycerol-phosphate synthase subunit HisF
MLRARIIPCLLVHKKGLVKTTNFKNPKYVGDPINAVKIFNEKEVDELMVLDIDATSENRGPDFEMIKNLANECRMPFCYGGGVSSVDQAKKIISLGAEKVAISYAAIRNPQLLKDIGTAVGNQSVVVIIDVRKRSLLRGAGYEIFIKNGTESVKVKLSDFVKQLNEIGVGEIVIQSIDNDGVMGGYDLDLINLLRSITDIPLTVIGGAGSLNDIKELIEKYTIIGVAAGSLFVFKGKYKAVLINYPNREEKLALFNS